MDRDSRCAAWRTASAERPASSAAMAAARRRSRSFTCARSWDTASDSVVGIMNAEPELDVLPDGTQGVAAVAEDDDDEKLSSDQHTLSRRNATEARRRPVCSSTIASSMRPRWKQAWPRTKYLYVPYLHWVPVLGFLERPARTRRLSSEMSKQQKERTGRASGSASSERWRSGEKSLAREIVPRSPEPVDKRDADEDEEVSSPEHDLPRLGM
ncbi:uncharacterized protein [Zea mays]|uniref:uncharacterized protein n=1 Tax=Zea mays TaxID=4577 RepID=UPI0009AA96AE|nr:uncharacterized protein LOC109944491 [Zea mays]|eukprot:XP_020404867.1 uncharacterized protein LOC109944491 [Zea mays]